MIGLIKRGARSLDHISCRDIKKGREKKMESTVSLRDLSRELSN